jgi:hypothetical protein
LFIIYITIENIDSDVITKYRIALERM